MKIEETVLKPKYKIYLVKHVEIFKIIKIFRNVLETVRFQMIFSISTCTGIAILVL